MRRKYWKAITAAVLLTALLALIFAGSIKRIIFKSGENNVQQGLVSDHSMEDIEVAAQNLTVPWEIVFLPDGDMLVTERSGTLKRIGKNNQTHIVEGVQHTSEGGLLGLALHPNFQENKFIYVYLTTRNATGLVNRVERYHYDADKLTDKTAIISDIPGASNHDGGRIAFGPDKKLYVTTGDTANEQLAQDKNSLAGKILRLNDDGSTPADNPFRNAVFSYGHRNPQGLAWDDEGQLWSTEHGRSGVRSGYDELNLITRGANYGWPSIEGDESASGMVKPVAHSGASDTWAPASLAYFNGSLYFGGLRGESLYQAKTDDNNQVTLTAYFKGEYGRIRAASLGSDNFLYISTSNTDGRGDIKPNDDKILRINIDILNR